LYSSVSDKELFSRVGFYRDDIEALKMNGDQVLATNSLVEILKFSPELMVAYFYSKSILAALVCHFIGCRVILTGGADQISPVLSWGWPLRMHQISAFISLLLAHRIFLSCSDDFENFSKLCFNIKFLKKKLVRVNHAVCLTGQIRIDNVRPIGRFYALTLCWMGAVANVRRKGVDRAINLVALLRRIGVDAALDIAGTDGPGREYLDEIIKNLKLSEYVHFLGSISEQEKSRRFAARDVYLQLSEYEGFGVAAAEAFFAGMVVAHSNKGGLRDVIGEHGLIVDIAMIDNEDLKAVDKFYSDFLKYKVNLDFIKKKIEDYSISMRSKSFYEEI